MAGTTTLGRYELGSLLGEGGAGRVFEATLVGPGGFRKSVALKVLHRGGDQLTREARIGGLLRHRNLVDVYEIGQIDGQSFCALERCVGSVADLGPLPPRAVVEVGLQVCDALRYAHQELGLVHLDLKPENLLYDADGVIKVADLGIAHAEGFAADGGIRGTPGYMAPEQAQGRSVDARADIHALGVTLLELAGARASLAAETLDFFELDAPSDGDRGQGAAPDWLAPIVERCTRDDPAERYPDMAALRKDLAELEASGAGIREVLGVQASEPVVRPGQLPERDPRWVGRPRWVDAVVESCGEPGWTAVTGPAGIGKSQVAIEGARGTGLPAMYCDVAETVTPDGLLYAVSEALDVRIGRRDGVEVLGRVLCSRGPSVLLLDNLDHLEGFQPILDRWLQAAPELRVLTTSRLAWDGPRREVSVGPMEPEEAEALVVARAKARGVDPSGDPRLAELIDRLDGIPLALELAAGRLGVLTLPELLERLNLGLLRAGRAGRHGTLHGALEASWSLLGSAEQAMLAQLSVFSGGFEISAVEEVVAGEASALDTLDRLARASMAHSDPGGRFHLLASVQEFASDHLSDPEAEQRHGEWAAGLPRNRWRAELDNLATAAHRAALRGDAAIAARTASLSAGILQTAGSCDRAIGLLREALACVDPETEDGVKLERALASALASRGEHLEAEPLARRALAWFEVQGSPDAIARSLVTLGRVLHVKDDLASYGEQDACYRRAAELFQQVGNLQQLSVVSTNIGSMARQQGRLDEARRWFDEAVRIDRLIGERAHEGVVLANLGVLSWRRGEHDEAIARFDQALPLLRDERDWLHLALATGNLALVHASRGDLTTAASLLVEAIEGHRRVGNRRSEGVARSNLGKVHLELGDPSAARENLLAAMEIFREQESWRHVGIAEGGLADLAHQQGDLAEARRRSLISVAALRNVNAPVELGERLACLALLELEGGDRQRATRALAEARAILERTGLPAGSQLGQQVAKATRAANHPTASEPRSPD